MTGILCNPKKELKYAQIFYTVLKDLNKFQDKTLIIFSLPNIDIRENTVLGNLVTSEKIKLIQADLPEVIFNLSVQHSNQDIKKMRNLSQTEDLTVINMSNRYNQLSVMEMLNSDLVTGRYILPYYNKKTACFSFSEAGNFILKPANGSNRSKVIYCRRLKKGFELFNRNGVRRSKIFDADNAMQSIVKNGEWILIRTSELLTFKSMLLTARVYMQKDNNQSFKIISKTLSLRIKSGNIPEMDSCALQSANLINCFIPDISICFIDFVFGSDGAPYFLDFGGFAPELLGFRQNRSIREEFCENILNFRS